MGLGLNSIFMFFIIVVTCSIVLLFILHHKNKNKDIKTPKEKNVEIGFNTFKTNEIENTQFNEQPPNDINNELEEDITEIENTRYIEQSSSDKNNELEEEYIEMQIKEE